MAQPTRRQPGSPRLRMWVAAICNLLTWGAVLAWYVLEFPKWMTMLQKTGLPLDPLLFALNGGYPLVGVLTGAGVLLLAFVASWGRLPRTFVNIHLLSALLAAVAVMAFMWGIYQTAKPILDTNFRLF